MSYQQLWNKQRKRVPNEKTKRTERLGENQSMVWEWGDTVKSELVKPSSELAPPPG